MLVVALLCLYPFCFTTGNAADSGQDAGSPVTIAVTGDIGNWKQRKPVSDVIAADSSVKAVLLVGDTYNSRIATMENYKETYAGTYDRFMDRTYPCPGNHDKVPGSETNAYSVFWKDKAHAPGLYYSFDLGGWHIVSLNCLDVTTNQLEWLKKDLASKAGMPVIAFWHYPLFSSSRHGGSHAMSPFGKILLEHGPALVFSGHNHVYERFEPLDFMGNSSTPGKGLIQFVIGPGGSKPTTEQKSDAKPQATVFHGGKQHVGFFTLSPDGSYKFSIKALDDDGKVSEIDSGSGKLKD
jgi:hypothetical protein